MAPPPWCRPPACDLPQQQESPLEVTDNLWSQLSSESSRTARLRMIPAATPSGSPAQLAFGHGHHPSTAGTRGHVQWVGTSLATVAGDQSRLPAGPASMSATATFGLRRRAARARAGHPLPPPSPTSPQALLPAPPRTTFCRETSSRSPHPHLAALRPATARGARRLLWSPNPPPAPMSRSSSRRAPVPRQPDPPPRR